MTKRKRGSSAVRLDGERCFRESSNQPTDRNKFVTGLKRLPTKPCGSGGLIP